MVAFLESEVFRRFVLLCFFLRFQGFLRFSLVFLMFFSLVLGYHSRIGLLPRFLCHLQQFLLGPHRGTVQMDLHQEVIQQGPPAARQAAESVGWLVEKAFLGKRWFWGREDDEQHVTCRKNKCSIFCLTIYIFGVDVKGIVDKYEEIQFER